MSSVFSQIVAGDIPSYKVYEDENVLAIMDIHPIQPGQVVVFPKIEIDHLWDLSEDDYNALWQAVRRIGRHMREKLPSSRIGIQVEGLDVPHVHVKLVPFSTPEEFRCEPTPADKADLAKMAELLKL
jgi:histidine triad (HIT) family protein